MPQRKRKLARAARRPWLDPRLDALLALGQRLVASLRRRELEALHELALEIDKARLAARLRGRPGAAGRRLLAELQQRVFSPLTAAIRFPGEQQGLPERLRRKREPVLSVFVRSGRSASYLRRHGIHVRCRSGDVFTAWATWSTLESIASVPDVRHVELARASRPSLNLAMQYTGLDVMHGTHQGDGVIVGIADRYLDVQHPAFRDAVFTGTRILWLWDQELTAQGSERSPAGTASAAGSTAGLNFGVEYSKTEIDQDLALAPALQSVRHRPPARLSGLTGRMEVPEEHWHGTQVSGCAVGNGSGDGPALKPGAAPAAELIFVHLKPEIAWRRTQRAQAADPSLALVDTTDIANAASYIFARAQSAGKPCVLCLSQNDTLGSHDGTSALEKHLSGLIDRAGRAWVNSAGNEADQNAHFTDDLSPGWNEIYLSHPDLDVPEEIQVWLPGGSDWGFEVTHDPDSPLGGNRTCSGITGDPALTKVLRPFGRIRVVSTHGVLANGDDCISIFLIPLLMKSGIAAARLRIRIHCGPRSARVHAWTTHANAGMHFETPTDKGTVAPPATGAKAIVAGAHFYPSSDPNAEVPGPQVADQSGRGRTRDDRPSPDVCAPVSVSAPIPLDRSMPLAPGTPQYGRISGTSVAAPLVAGAAAIIFEWSSNSADWATVQDDLRTHAQPQTAAVPDDAWGWGSLSADGLCPPVMLQGIAAPRHWAAHPPGFNTEQAQLAQAGRSGRRRKAMLQLAFPEKRTGFELRLRPGLGRFEVEMPLAALAHRLGSSKRTTFDEAQAGELLDVEGARSARILGNMVSLRASERLFVPRTSAAAGPLLPLRIRVFLTDAAVRGPVLRLHQFLDGRWLRVVRFGVPRRV